MATKGKAGANVPEVSANALELNEVVNVRSIADVTRDLIANGGVMLKDVTVRSVTVIPAVKREGDDAETRRKNARASVALNLKQYIKTMKVDASTGTSVEDKTSMCFTSNFDIARCLRDKEGYAWLAQYIVDHPKSLSVILEGAKVSIVQTYLVAGNPINHCHTEDGSDVDDDTAAPYDRYINEVVGITFTDTALRRIARIEDRLLMED